MLEPSDFRQPFYDGPDLARLYTWCRPACMSDVRVQLGAAHHAVERGSGIGWIQSPAYRSGTNFFRLGGARCRYSTPVDAGLLDCRGRGLSVRVEALDHIHRYAADPEESAAFYRLHFEAKQAHRNVTENGDLRIFLVLSGQTIVLGSFPTGMASVPPPEAGDGADVHRFGIAHFGLRVADLKASIDEVSTSGVPVLREVILEPRGPS